MLQIEEKLGSKSRQKTSEMHKIRIKCLSAALTEVKRIYKQFSFPKWKLSYWNFRSIPKRNNEVLLLSLRSTMKSLTAFYYRTQSGLF